MNWAKIRDHFNFVKPSLDKLSNSKIHNDIAEEFYSCLMQACNIISQSDFGNQKSREFLGERFIALDLKFKKDPILQNEYNNWIYHKALIWMNPEFTTLLNGARPADVDGSIESIKMALEDYFDRNNINVPRFTF